MRTWLWLVGLKKVSKPSKYMTPSLPRKWVAKCRRRHPCVKKTPEFIYIWRSQVVQRLFAMVRQVFPERTIYQRSQLASSVRNNCPSRRPMRLGARHRRPFGHRRPIPAAVPCCSAFRPPLRHRVTKYGRKGRLARCGRRAIGADLS